MHVGERVARLTLWYSRTSEDQRAAHALFVDVLFAEQAVTSHRQPVIRRVYHYGVISVWTVLQSLQDATDLFVKMSDQSVILTKLIADDLFGSRPRRKALVTARCCLWGILKWMLRQEVLRKRRTLSIVHLTILLWRVSRVVRSHECDVKKEGLLASRVADEIRSPPITDTDVATSMPERVLPGSSQIFIAVLIVIATAFAWLYWQREQSWTDLQLQNVELQRALNERQATATQDSDEILQQLDEYQDSLDVATNVALDGLEWAANQSSQYGFDELPMGDFRLSLIQELVNHLSALDFRGLVRIESHVGNFCMTIAGPSGYALAPTDLSASQCEQIGFEPGEAYELGMRQSVAFANFVNLTGERTGGAIRFEIISLGNSNPLLDYPATAAGVTASAWNDIAASNNRVEISLYPYLP